jgi:hypothetical protein
MKREKHKVNACANCKSFDLKYNQFSASYIYVCRERIISKREYFDPINGRVSETEFATVGEVRGDKEYCDLFKHCKLIKRLFGVGK